MTQLQFGGQTIRAGFRLLFLGFLMSFGMVMHYVVGARYPTGPRFLENITLWYACPWTLSTAVVLGGSLAMMIIGTVYVTLEKLTGDTSVGFLARSSRHLFSLSLIGIFLTGYVGFYAVDWVWPGFYYSVITEGKNVWLFMQLACMLVFGTGVLFAFLGVRRASLELK